MAMPRALRTFVVLAELADIVAALSVVQSRLHQDSAVVRKAEHNARGDDEPATTSWDMQSCQVWSAQVSGFDDDTLPGPRYLELLSGDRSSGRVRMQTFDGRPLNDNAFETGDFWLVRSDTVHIQARFRYSEDFLPKGVAIGAVAVGGSFLKGRTIVVEPLDGEVTVGGKRLPHGGWSDSVEEISVRKARDEDVEAALPMGVKLLFKRFPKHIDVKITMPRLPGGSDGQCGNYDGIPENDGDMDVQRRMGKVTVDDSMLLFADKFAMDSKSSFNQSAGSGNHSGVNHSSGNHSSGNQSSGSNGGSSMNSRSSSMNSSIMNSSSGSSINSGVSSRWNSGSRELRDSNSSSSRSTDQNDSSHPSNSSNRNERLNGTILSEEGYQAAAALHDDKVMTEFVNEVLSSENLIVPPGHDKQLATFASFFSGTRNTQTFKKMKRKLANKSWVQKAQTTGVAVVAA